MNVCMYECMHACMYVRVHTDEALGAWHAGPGSIPSQIGAQHPRACTRLAAT